MRIVDTLIVIVAEKNGSRYLVLETSKDALQTAPGYTFDRSEKVWLPAASKDKRTGGTMRPVIAIPS